MWIFTQFFELFVKYVELTNGCSVRVNCSTTTKDLRYGISIMLTHYAWCLRYLQYYAQNYASIIEGGCLLAGINLALIFFIILFSIPLNCTRLYLILYFLLLLLLRVLLPFIVTITDQ